MIYSRSCEYAIRALVHLAQQPEGHYCTIQEIHEQENIPRGFLGKLLQTLGKRGLVCSQKGPHGGFMLAMPASQITILQVMEQVDGLGQLDRCVFGLGKCGGLPNCPVNHVWCQVKEEMQKMLESQTIGALVRSLNVPCASAEGR